MPVIESGWVRPYLQLVGMPCRRASEHAPTAARSGNGLPTVSRLGGSAAVYAIVGPTRNRLDPLPLTAAERAELTQLWRENANSRSSVGGDGVPGAVGLQVGAGQHGGGDGADVACDDVLRDGPARTAGPMLHL